jgi:hypothetical protein
MRNGLQPSVPVRGAAQPQPQQQPQDAPHGLVGMPNSFLKADDPRRGTSTVIPAGVSQFQVGEDTNPFPGRTSADERRLAYAQSAREAEAATRLSGGPGTVRNSRAQAHEGYEAVVVRDRFDRLRTDYVRRDAAGRPSPPTDVDQRGFTPGRDLW